MFRQLIFVQIHLRHHLTAIGLTRPIAKNRLAKEKANPEKKKLGTTKSPLMLVSGLFYLKN